MCAKVLLCGKSEVSEGAGCPTRHRHLGPLTSSSRGRLASGRPVRMMAGAPNVHDDTVVNLLGELRGRLRGSGCRPFTGDGSVETLPGQIRRPNAGADRGQRDPDGMKAALPRMVAEVLSPSTRDFDTFEKLAEYKQPGIHHGCGTERTRGRRLVPPGRSGVHSPHRRGASARGGYAGDRGHAAAGGDLLRGHVSGAASTGQARIDPGGSRWARHR